jgi:membrane protease YdiL (CAAX protease family)
MTFEEHPPQDVPPDDTPPPDATPLAPPPPPERESPLLLVLGAFFFLLVVGVMWGSAYVERKATPATVPTDRARVYTYITETAWYLQRYSGLPAEARDILKTTEYAREAATAWQDVARKGKPAVRARAHANAAACYGLAEQPRRAVRALNEAAEIHPAGAAVYRQLQGLYRSPMQAITLNPAIDRVLAQLPAGPIYRARIAQLRGDDAALRAALQPGWAAGVRVFVLNAVLLLFIGGLLLTAIILAIAKRRRIAAELQAVQAPAPPVPWDIGTALLLISAVYLLSFGLTIVFSLPFGNQLKQAPEVSVVLSTLSLLAAMLLVVSSYLVLHGKPPWAWEMLGWRRAPRGIGFGALGLLLTLPLLVVAYLLAAALFDTGEQQQIVQIIQSSGIVLQLYLVVVAALMAPLVEETLFRGLLFRALNARLPFWPAACISAVIFAAGHAQLLALLPVTLLGVLFAFLTRRSGTLLASAGAHGVYNAVVGIIAILTAWVLHGPGG